MVRCASALSLLFMACTPAPTPAPTSNPEPPVPPVRADPPSDVQAASMRMRHKSEAFAPLQSNNGVAPFEGDCGFAPKDEQEQCNRQLQTVRTLLEGVVFPANVRVAVGLDPVPDLFNDNVRCIMTHAYVQPTTGIDNCTDWLYTYAGHLDALGAVVGVNVYSYRTNGRMLTLNLFTTEAYLDTPPVFERVRLEFLFDDHGRILAYDMLVPHYGLTWKHGDYKWSQPDEQEVQIQHLCQLQEAACPGAYKPYDSFDSCVELNRAESRAGRHGNPDGLARRSTICRLWHGYLAWGRPMHCAHMALDGGGKCEDFAIEEMVGSHNIFPFYTPEEIARYSGMKPSAPAFKGSVDQERDGELWYGHDADWLAYRQQMVQAAERYAVPPYVWDVAPGP